MNCVINRVRTLLDIAESDKTNSDTIEDLKVGYQNLSQLVNNFDSIELETKIKIKFKVNLRKCIMKFKRLIKSCVGKIIIFVRTKSGFVKIVMRV